MMNRNFGFKSGCNFSKQLWNKKNIVSLSDIIYSVAQKEEKFFRELKKWVLTQKN